MILQSLIALYDRLNREKNEESYDEEGVPPLGFSVEDIGFAITIDREGNLIGEPEDLREKISGQKYEYRRSTVPYSNEINVRSSNAAKTSNFMVDKADYIFGMSGTSPKNEHWKSFRDKIDEVCENSQDAGVLAVKAFLRQWNPADSTRLSYWEEICGSHGKWAAFKLEGDRDFIHERSEVRELWRAFIERKEYPRGISLVDGQIHNLQLQYAQFPFGTGASLVSFNKDAYESYGKRRGENAPISVDAEFKSSAALKFLLRGDTQCLRIEDATTLFWTERKTPVESYLGMFFDPGSGDGETNAAAVRKFLEAARKGVLLEELEEDGEVSFYILGLALNKARLALRFWYVCSVEKLMRRLGSHFECLKMEKDLSRKSVQEEENQNPSIWHLLKETARKPKDISPVLSGALMRSILTGSQYPMSLYQGVMGRIRADRDVNHPRASILKAVLVRNYNKEIPMSLNTERRETAYLLGRLFAVLEKVQSDALGKDTNTTIKGSYFSAAAATPARVFPRLLQLSQHHIRKAEYGNTSDKRIGEIMENIENFPPQMGLQDQGLFAIAYYQQKNEIYRKKDKNH